MINGQRHAVIVRRRDAGEKFKDIAADLGVSRQAVHRMYWRAKRQGQQQPRSA